MPATVTLAQTTLAEGCDAAQTRIKLTSTAGVLPGLKLYTDGEVLAVMRLDIDPWVQVRRGSCSTAAMSHYAGSIVYIGRDDQFFQGPPVGRPAPSIPVSPYIDVVGGKIYFAQGDAVPAGTLRWWQAQTQTATVGPLGVRSISFDPTSST